MQEGPEGEADLLADPISAPFTGHVSRWPRICGGIRPPTYAVCHWYRRPP